MLLILSPAKKMDFNKNVSDYNCTNPHFAEESKQISEEIKNMSVDGIKQLMSLSDNLAKLNYQRYQDFY